MPGMRPCPCFQIIAPGQSDAGEVVEATARTVLGEVRTVVEHQRLAYGGLFSQVEDEAGRKPPLGPRLRDPDRRSSRRHARRPVNGSPAGR